MEGARLIGAILVGLVAGFLAAQLTNREHGLLTNLVVGLVGALIGAFLSNAMGFIWSGWIGGVAVAAISAVVLLGLLGLVRRP